MTLTVHLFVFDTAADWEAAYAVAGINSYRAFQREPGRYSVRTAGLTTAPVKTMGGVTVLPDCTLDEVDPVSSAMFILPGGTAWDEGKNGGAVDKAKAFLAAGVPVAAICGATAGLARERILDDKQHTSNAADYLKATGYGGAALYQVHAAVTDGNVITAGGMFPVDFAFHILKKLGLYDAPILDAWYGLFKTGQSSYYLELARAVQGR